MKKFLAIVLALVLVLGLVACGDKKEAAKDNTKETYEIAMITDVGEIDDKSFNQGTWEGIKAYAEKNNISHKYYKPTEQTEDAYLAAIQLAVKGGAKIVVTPGYLFEVPIYRAQEMYPEVHFVLIDGYPNDGTKDANGNTTAAPAKNSVGIKFAEEQSGYLAGYAAVIDGYTKLGFMGGMAVPAVVRYGYGFAQGADAAAKELGLAAGSIEMKYNYTGGFDATPEVQTLASSWYSDGTEVIFGCGGKVGNAVMAAAESAKGKVIGVDVDQSSESDTVITSAMKGLAASVQSMLSDYYGDKFPGAQSLTLGAAEDGVQLPMDTSKFNTFTKDDYDAVYKQLASGEIKLQKDDVKSADQLGLSYVKVQVIK